MGNLQIAPGSLFADRFEIERVAGSGGMGTVYRAKDRTGGNTVALKLLHVERGAAGVDETDRFLREAQLLSELRHPGIVSHVMHGQTPEGQRFLVMEWLEGEDLAARLLRGPLLLRDSLQILEQVADALAVAHQRGIIHRDLKPTNLFLVGGDVGRVKILDFGIARRVGSAQAVTQTGIILGTPEYMAPEQARGSRELTPAADLFSLGCVLYECLAGQPPFVADHFAAVLVRILLEDPRPIGEHRPGLPSEISDLLRRLLDKQPHHRLADATALRAELVGLGDFPETALAVTMAIPQPAVVSFADGEQSLYSVVLACAPEGDVALDATQPGGDIQLSVTNRLALMQALVALGGTADFLANGNLVVTVPPLGSAQDQAAVAARAALMIKERWPEAIVSMATGRGVVRGRSAVGEVVDFAARALKADSAAGGGTPQHGVRIDSLSAKLLDGRFRQSLQPGGALLVQEEQDVDTSRPLLGKPTPCVGREAELGILETRLAACIEESEARALLFTAPPGVGKSRLRHEFLRRQEKRTEPLTVLNGRGERTDAGSPYGILGKAVRRLCGISDSEPAEQKRERLTARIGQHLDASDTLRIVLFLGQLADVRFPPASSVMLPPALEDPRIMRDRIRRAFLDWLAAEGKFAPILLVLDDLQWGDALSVDLLNDALRELASLPLFVFALARPEVTAQFPKLWHGHRMQEIPLKGLSKRACERLVQQVVGNRLSPETMARTLDRAGGNALFLEELIRAAAEDKLQDQPETILAMLQSRISRLKSGARRAVLAASVFGQTFWAGGVAAVLGLPREAADISPWLQGLEEAELIQLSTGSRYRSEPEYSFRHALVRDAAYALLGPQDLTAGHYRVAQFLEQRGERDAAILADHYERSGEKTRAAALYNQAAEQACDAFLNERALGWCERGIACLPDSAVLAQLQTWASFAHLSSSRIEQAAGLVNQALPVLLPGSRAWTRAMHVAFISSLFGSAEAQMQVPVLATQLAQTEPSADAIGQYIEVLALFTAVFPVAVPEEQMRPLIARLQAVCQRVSPHDPTIMRHLHFVRAHTAWHLRPQPWFVLTQDKEISRLCTLSGDCRTALMISTTESVTTWMELGDVANGLEDLAAVQKFAAGAQEPVLLALLQLQIVRLRWLRGDADVAPELLATAKAFWQTHTAFVSWAGLAHDVAARTLLAAGRAEEAESQAREACRILTSTPNFYPNTHATLIHSLLQQQKHSEAFAAVEAALALIRHFRCLGHAEVELRLAISEAFHALGDLPRAQAELGECLHQIKLRADDITDPFWQNSYLTRNPYCASAQVRAKEWGLNARIP